MPRATIVVTPSHLHCTGPPEVKTYGHGTWWCWGVSSTRQQVAVTPGNTIHTASYCRCSCHI